jgi:hypothetical protein
MDGLDRKKYIFAVCWAAVFILCGASAAKEQRLSACITCHEYLGGALAGPVLEWKGSIHRQNGIACELCHGGNADVDIGNIKELSPQQLADSQSLAMSKSSGFIGKPSGKDMFAMCASCHDDAVGRYEYSIMGKAFLGNKGGPSCVACHNAHNNTIPEIPRVCESCHKDTVGFDRIDSMSVSESTINELSSIRIKLAEERARGAKPPLVPKFPEELGSFQTGLVVLGVVVVLFIIGSLVYMILEKRR